MNFMTVAAGPPEPMRLFGLWLPGTGPQLIAMMTKSSGEW